MKHYQHSVAAPIKDLIPEIKDLLDTVVNKYKANMGFVSSADSTHCNVLTVSYRDVQQELPTLRIPHNLETSFCTYTIHRPIPVIIQPLQESPTFYKHFLTTNYNCIAYIGAPIVVVIDNNDEYIGSLCLFFDHEVNSDIRHYESISEDLALLVAKKLGQKNAP